jgi:hypothetical protein
VDVSGDVVRPLTGKEGHTLHAGIVDCENTLKQPALSQINQREIVLTQQEGPLMQQQQMMMMMMMMMMKMIVYLSPSTS